jgi:hypothetical protein
MSAKVSHGTHSAELIMKITGLLKREILSD